MIRQEIGLWIRFIIRRVFEFVCLTAWFVIVWLVDEFLVKKFSVNGFPRIILTCAEFAFNATSLYELLVLLVDQPKKHSNLPWWK